MKEYFFIQQTRFGERIQFVTDIQDDCLDIEIPSLTLQPLIENAFIHGVESLEEDAVISLNIYRQMNWIYVEVNDNGVGMEEAIKMKLRDYARGIETEEPFDLEKSKGHSTGIGVKNVLKRLQLFYHRNDIVEIDSELNKGTTFRLIIPEVVKGEDKFA